MTIIECEAHFYALPKYVISSVFIEYQKIKKFFKGLSSITS